MNWIAAFLVDHPGFLNADSSEEEAVNLFKTGLSSAREADRLKRESEAPIRADLHALFGTEQRMAFAPLLMAYVERVKDRWTLEELAKARNGGGEPSSPPKAADLEAKLRSYTASNNGGDFALVGFTVVKKKNIDGSFTELAANGENLQDSLKKAGASATAENTARVVELIKKSGDTGMSRKDIVSALGLTEGQWATIREKLQLPKSGARLVGKTNGGKWFSTT